MRIKKENLSSFAFIILAAVLLFTPVGFYARVFVSKILAFSPSVVPEEDQFILSDYHWKLLNSKEEIIDFHSLKGKIVLVNVWATWCPPCVAEMPSLQELYTDYGDRIEFLFIAHDERKKVLDFMIKNQFNLPIYYESSSAPKQLEATSIPTTFVIDSDGKIILYEVGAADWNSEKTRSLLDRLLSKLN